MVPGKNAGSGIHRRLSLIHICFLAAGLCRIFKEDGLSVAPFKSQNMALNSYITEEGLEMGRAQVMQAEAAGIRPEAAMNPVLLKPTSHMGSQVIVNGEVLGNYSAAEYFKMKKSLIPEIKKAYDSLAERFDVIVVEGAGSPAEINLRAVSYTHLGGGTASGPEAEASPDTEGKRRKAGDRRGHGRGFLLLLPGQSGDLGGHERRAQVLFPHP